MGKEIENLVKEGNQQKVEIVRKIMNQIYVDKLISGATTCDEIKRMYVVIKDIFRKASLNMRTWASNAPGMDKMISVEDLENTQTQKVLGMTWRLDDDKWEISLQKEEKPNEPVTKRKILFRLAQNYDPLGLLAPASLKAKLLVQSLWKKSFTWDENLPEEIQRAWSEIQKSWNITSKFKMA